MIEKIISMIAVLIAVTGIIILIYFLRKMERKNRIVSAHESELHWKDIKCSYCGQYVDQGYAFAGKGISWTPRQHRKPGVFSTVVSSLENTISMRIPPPLNMAWHCNNCKLIVIDHSKMISLKKS